MSVLARALLATGAVGLTALIVAAPAGADDDQYLADLTAPQMVHPPLPSSELLVEGRQVCVQIGKAGITPDAARDWVLTDLDKRGVTSDYATAGTLVHFALRDLCPNVPNPDGI